MLFLSLLFQIIVTILQLLLLIFHPGGQPLPSFLTQGFFSAPITQLSSHFFTPLNTRDFLFTTTQTSKQPLFSSPTQFFPKFFTHPPTKASAQPFLSPPAQVFPKLFTPPALISPLSFLLPTAQASTHTLSPTIVFADDFSQDLSQWQLLRGSWSYWHITADGWLEGQLNSPQTVSILVPKDEFWSVTADHYQLEFDFEVLSQADINFSWGLADLNNWYEIHFYGGWFHLIRLQDGEVVFAQSGEYLLPRYTSHRAYIVFNQGKIQVWIDDELVVSLTDTTYQAKLPDELTGKPALRITTGSAFPTRIRFNNFKVWAYQTAVLPEFPLLPLTAFSQTDPRWQDEEYNHALSWRSWGDWASRPPPHNQPPTRVTMHHWGCAVSSLAMVMTYHGLSRLPDGQVLTPSTLNSWLKHQADGFVGDGLLNWLAGMRLSRLIAQTYSTAWHQLPSLEFHRSFSPTKQGVKNLVDEDRLAIIQIPGHFLVAHGYEPNPDLSESLDLIISDPAYSYTHLSQHQHQMVSAIDLRPSFTDLSYLMLVYDASLTIKLLNETLEPIYDSFFAQDTIKDQFFDTEQCYLEFPDQYEQFCWPFITAPVIQYLAKPASGVYYLQVLAENSPEDTNQQLNSWQILAYDEVGAVRMIDRFSGLEPEMIRLEFNRQEASAVTAWSETSYDFVSFKHQLQAQLLESNINQYHYLRLAEVADWALATNQTLVQFQQDRYAQLILALIKSFELELTAEAQLELRQALLAGPGE